MIANRSLNSSLQLLIVAFLVLLNSSVTFQQSCTLPGSHQESTCEKIHRCDYFQNILRRYGGRPPQNVVDDIRLHQCPGSSNVCCPDNAGPPPPPQDLKIQNPILTSIRNHRNIHLINQKSCGVVATNRVIGGFNADIKEFPWVALLGYRSAKQTDWQCGGTLISQRFVLTAAHCVEKDLYLVRLGEHTISKQTDCDDTDQCADPVQDIMIDSKLKHPQFDRRAKQNDLALLKLMKPADITKNNVKTICLPITPQNNVEEYDKPNMLLILTGWGKTDGGTKSDILQKAYVPYIDSEACNAIFNPEGFDIHPGQLCAGYAKGSANKKTDSCKGDSGGGLVGYSVYDEKAKVMLYGVVSAGIKCEDPYVMYPGIYMDVKHFLTWILDNISE